MKSISSPITPIVKRIAPAIWLGIPVIQLVQLVYYACAAKQFTGFAPLIVVGVISIPITAAILYWFMKWFFLDLVDEVWDADSELIIKDKGREIHVALSDIANVSYGSLTPITLQLRRPSEFGSQIKFAPPWRPWPPSLFSTPAEVRDLIARIDAARG